MRILWAVLLLCPLLQCQVPASSTLNPAAVTSQLLPDILKELNAAATSVIDANASPRPLAAMPGGGSLPSATVITPMIRVAPVTKRLVLASKVDSQAARNRQIWYSLLVLEHGAAAFDGWTTRRAIDRGAVELNPMIKPFARSAALYPALQLWPAGMDYIGMRLMRSNRPVCRKLWWVPQAASATASIAFGIRNMGVQTR